jgi:hypothetical protein
MMKTHKTQTSQAVPLAGRVGASRQQRASRILSYAAGLGDIFAKEAAKSLGTALPYLVAAAAAAAATTWPMRTEIFHLLGLVVRHGTGA